MIFTLLITVLLTGIVLVVAAYAIAKLIGPRSYNPVKGEPFECGIPTYGSSWVPMHVGYYLFAILFLMFDVETVFLYPGPPSSASCRVNMAAPCSSPSDSSCWY